MNRDRVRGMIVGGAIGDAVGMPVETWTPAKIKEMYPQGISRFIPPKDHKWFDPEKTPAGSTTDDTQLTIATMKGLIKGQEKHDGSIDPYMDAISAAHCDAMQETTAGWGGTTREAIRRLQNGVHWNASGKTTEKNRGTGNGVPMKIAPLAAFLCTTSGKDFKLELCIPYSAMTHYTKLSAHSAIAHVLAMTACLTSSEGGASSIIDIRSIVATTVGKFMWNRTYEVEHLEDTTDQLQTRMEKLVQLLDQLPSMTTEEIIAEFGNGSCYVYDSLPFSYAFFLKNPFMFQTILDVVHAGGDTDTNAKIVGEMMGALHGYESLRTYVPWAFEKENGLKGLDELLELSDLFCDRFGI